MNQARLLLAKLTQSPFRNVSTTTTTTLRNAYCTATATVTHNSTKRTYKKRNVSLYRIMSPFGNPNITFWKRFLDHWINKGHSVDEVELRNIVKRFHRHRRFTHALEISTWMTEKKFVEVTATDVAMRLDLIAKVNGIQKAEDYFNLTPTELKTVEVYSALLKSYAYALSQKKKKSYAYAKCVEKAEGVMQKMRDLGFASDTLPHNVMLNLYCRTDNRDKVADVVLEMEAKNIKYDNYTYNILMNLYGTFGNIDGLERIIGKMESDPEVDIDLMAYAVVADDYIRFRMSDKALESLAYTSILRIYGALGKKDEVFRVWEECKKCKPTFSDYMTLSRAFLDSNDEATVEKISKDWEDSKLHKDIRVPNVLISIYCRIGLIEKAEALIERMKLLKWENPNSYMWSWMSFGYVKRNQMDKAVEAMKSALSETNCLVFRKNWLEGLVSCLKYLKDKKDSEQEQVNAIIETLKDRRLVSAKVLEKLVEYLSGKCDVKDVLRMDDEEGTSNEN